MNDYEVVATTHEGDVVVFIKDHEEVGFRLHIPSDKKDDMAFTWLANNLSAVAVSAIDQILEGKDDE